MKIVLDFIWRQADSAKQLEMPQPFYKKAGVQAAIAGGIIAGIFLLIKHQSNVSNAQKIANPVNSPTTQINQPSNSTVNNNSGNITLNNHGNLNNQQAPLYAPGSVFNYYSTPTSNTVTREAFESFEGVVSNAMSNTTERVELTAQQVQLLAQALRDLDQRTSDIEKLPDGRTKFGSFVTGRPRVAIDAFDAGIHNYTNRNFQSSLENFERCISIMEIPDPPDVSMSSGGITQEGKAAAYWYAGVCALGLGSNDMANSFAQKAVKISANWQSKGLYTATIANLAEEKMRQDDFAGSFELFRSAITNLDSIEWGTNKPSIDTRRLYAEAQFVASFVGRTNEAKEWRDKVRGVQP